MCPTLYFKWKEVLHCYAVLPFSNDFLHPVNYTKTDRFFDGSSIIFLIRKAYKPNFFSLNDDSLNNTICNAY